MAARTSASVSPAQLHQALDVAPRQQLHGLCADAQCGGGDRIARRVGQARLELQAQAFAQVARAHAGGFQRLQQAQRHAEAVLQFFGLLQVVAGQASGQRGEGIFQVAVVVERLDQEAQRRAVHLAQAQRQRLAVQEGRERLLAARQLGGVGALIVVAQVVLARGGVAAPFAVVRQDLGRAVAFPALRNRNFRFILVTSQRRLVIACYRTGSTLRLKVIAAHRGVNLRQSEFLARRLLGVQLQERVVVEHLLDLLAELQCGELQQTDRLLQLGSECKMLRNPQRKALLHGRTATRRRSAGPPLARRAPPGGSAAHAVASVGAIITFGSARPGTRGAPRRCPRSLPAYPWPAPCRR
jgi:hypothetical protein